jgi:hypothetical protein
MIAEKIESSFGFSTDAVRCALSPVNRQFSLPIDFNAKKGLVLPAPFLK